MSVVGQVDSLWRYPVKSMRGEELEEAFMGFPGVYGDRYFAFKSSASPKGFPYLYLEEAHTPFGPVLCKGTCLIPSSILIRFEP